MSLLDISQIIFISIVVIAGLALVIKVAIFDKDER
ncbi:hypothetical protein [Campylobacter sp. RM16187]